MTTAIDPQYAGSQAKEDIAVLRELAKQYVEIAHKPVQDTRRALWRQKNGLVDVPPLIYIRACAWHEMPQARCVCADPFYRHYEDYFRQMIFQDTFDDDYIIEPWVTLQATCVTPPEGIWGLPVRWTRTEMEHGSGVWDAPIKEPDDIYKLAEIHHVIDEEDTARRLEKLQEAIGDIVCINVDRGPVYRMWNGDISTQLAYLRGLEQMMWDMVDRPEWLHELLSIMRDGILRAHTEAEQAGDWRLCDHQNQSMPYALELDDPAANSAPVTRDKLWTYAASQETTAVGPAMFEEFMLQYQIPIMEKFGLVAYGCCEDLTRKIGVLRQIPRLRRIAVAPAANVAKCAEQIGQEYVVSYRPSPADMVSYRWGPERIRSILRRDLEACRECHVDITLKDVETVEGDPNRIRNWVALTRRVIDEFWPS
ncbi:MAG: hypothetical protein GX552_19335 [Chloroflexi bacterium]|nr:hypothetical protein [Chloroflexota bacterium]